MKVLLYKDSPTGRKICLRFWVKFCTRGLISQGVIYNTVEELNRKGLLHRD